MNRPPAGPTLALSEIRELVGARKSTAPPLSVNDALSNGHRLAELIEWLDEYLTIQGAAGPVPEQWR